MAGLAMFLGMSLSIGGIGGLLSGILARSLIRTLIWAVGFGLLETILVVVLSDGARFSPIFVLIAIVWSLVGWFAAGRFFARRRAAKAANVQSGAGR